MFVSPLFAMSGDGVDDIRIPMVFLFMEEAKKLLEVTSVFHTLPHITKGSFQKRFSGFFPLRGGGGNAPLSVKGFWAQ